MSRSLCIAASRSQYANARQQRQSQAQGNLHKRARDDQYRRKSTFPRHDLTEAFHFPKEEEKVLKYWRDIDAFQESLRQSKGRPAYTFFDGPPFATGLPHYGHLLMGTVKDVVTRFAHSNGYYVERRFGWDTHGLPVEREIDKKLNIQTRDDVMKMGIERYNAECRAIVMRYASEWRTTVERMGRWIDFDNDYKTLNATFMESVWWVFKQLWNKGAVYQGLRVMPYSTALTTPLSNFEAGLAYQDVADPAVTVAFELLDSDESASILAWTTTPWTLPSNLALCVHPDFTYLKIKDAERNRVFYIQEDLLRTLYKDPKKAKFQKLGTVKGKEMEGWRYKPLYPFFYEKFKDTAFRVLCDTYVKNDSGTGIVHQAPAFGDDDHRIAIAAKVVRKDEMPPMPLDEQGRYNDEVKYLADGKESGLAGIYIKDADKIIQKQLKESGHLIVQSQLTHSYPFCYRSNTPLVNRAISVWFVQVENIKEQLIANNNATRWVPAEVSEKRFTNWLANARDWSVSRNRYWGTPIPIWRSEDGEETVCIGSIEELNELSGCGILTDLHRESIDDITIPSKMGKGRLRRVPEVFDCWFESGSMPYAQSHYPFERKDQVEAAFPADFISEAMDQTRGWFYTLLVLSTHLFKTAPWKNLIVCGLVLAEDGKKMSKSLKNYPDPNLLLNLYGADALRLFLIDSPVVRGDNLRFREAGVKETISRVLLPWLNSFRFFLAQTNLLKKESGIDFKYNGKAAQSSNVMDRWILAKCQSLISHVDREMKAYRLFAVVPPLLELVDELTNWYVRLNRSRLKGQEGVESALVCLNCLFDTLLTLCRTLSSFTPFLSETIYQGLRPFLADSALNVNSIHFLAFPTARSELFDEQLERQIRRMQTVIELTRSIRESQKISVKIPLSTLTIYHASSEYLGDLESLKSEIARECNVRKINFTSAADAQGIFLAVQPNLKELGRRFGKDLGNVRSGISQMSQQDIRKLRQIGGFRLTDKVQLTLGSDVTITQSVSRDLSDETEDSATDNDVVVILDTMVSDAYSRSGLARELANAVQKARKKGRYATTDDLQAVIVAASAKDRTFFKSLLEEEACAILSITRRLPIVQEATSEDVKSDFEIDGHSAQISFKYPET